MQDWLSESLDLSDPAAYRDLGKPIGAINEDRLERFVERYHSLLGDESVAPFFFGTHYSSAGIVLWYMLRMSPYTALAHSLQVRFCSLFSSFEVPLVCLAPRALMGRVTRPHRCSEECCSPPPPHLHELNTFACNCIALQLRTCRCRLFKYWSTALPRSAQPELFLVCSFLPCIVLSAL